MHPGKAGVGLEKKPQIERGGGVNTPELPLPPSGVTCLVAERGLSVRRACSEHSLFLLPGFFLQSFLYSLLCSRPLPLPHPRRLFPCPSLPLSPLLLLVLGRDGMASWRRTGIAAWDMGKWTQPACGRTTSPVSAIRGMGSPMLELAGCEPDSGVFGAQRGCPRVSPAPRSRGGWAHRNLGQSGCGFGFGNDGPGSGLSNGPR